MEAFDIKPTFNKRYEIQEVLNSIHEYGFTRIPDFVSSEKLKELNLVFKLGLAHDNYPYGYGKLARFDVLPTELSFAKIFFEEQFFQEVISKYWEESSEIIQEYSFIHDFKFDPNTIYGNLHFDRRHQLKFMLYLTDVDSKKHGAFCAIPKSNVLGKSLYSQSWKSALSLESNDYAQIEKNARLLPDNDSRYKSLPFRIVEDNLSLNKFSLNDSYTLTGPAGTLIIFDTHVLHLGGLVEDNFERKTIRLHTFPK